MNLVFWEPSGAEYEPLRITATLSEPVVYAGDLLHFDGILAYAVYRDLPERLRRRIPPLSSEWVVDLPIPLGEWQVDVGGGWAGGDQRLLRRLPGRRGVAGHTSLLWGYRASAETEPWDIRGAAEIRKRPPLDEMRRYATDRSVQLAGGPLKARDVKMPTAFAPCQRWYAYGNKAEVQRLLDEHIPAIGKVRGHGHGTVLRWVVESTDVVCDTLVDRLPMRRLPVESGAKGTPRRRSIRPPYHHRSRVVDAVEPEC